MKRATLRYDLNWKSLAALLFHATVTFLYCILLSRRYLINSISKILLGRVFLQWRHTVYFKSGRAALCGLMAGLKRANPEHKIVFIPDYICNVVYQAAENAGFTVRSYTTDNHFSPVWEELLDSIKGQTYPVVLLASMFGTVNATQSRIRSIRHTNPSAFIIADECQHLVSNSPVGFDANMAIVFSFNKKTIYGLMGGGVCVNPNLTPLVCPLKSGVMERLEINARLSLHLFKELLIYTRIWLNKPIFYQNDTLTYEYSHGMNILYDTRPKEIAKISLVRAWLELRKMHTTEKLRKNNLHTIMQIMPGALLNQRLARLEDAAYVPVRINTANEFIFRQVFLKRPYAIHKNPDRAIKNVFCIVNSIPLGWTFKVDEAPK